MTLRCEEIDDLIGPYALDALEPDERLAVLEHLSECREHDAGHSAYRQIASSLPLAIDEVMPPPRLRNRLLSAFEASVRGGEPEAPAGPSANLRLLFRRPAFAYGLAVALLAIAVGLAAWNLSLRDHGAPSAHGIFARAAVERGDMRLRVLYVIEERLALFSV